MELKKNYLFYINLQKTTFKTLQNNTLYKQIIFIIYRIKDNLLPLAHSH